ncbi:glycosyltransferase family 2 protein [Algoriphagus vanfongensis]|uniref:glycosyltransferase family 2 protein n=1 Tax=Algoriphagus vanfongensis TaxID=426371 RepID=UPI00042340BC|nr:glycosyltransferase family A protein [Algoriphagus vanfongensis]
MDTNETKKFLDPKISIIIPFFNSESTLKRAVDSVILQSFEDWELILVNDGSTDQSEWIAKSFLGDHRILYSYQENMGVSAARNLGASKAKADWLIFLDSDDVLRPNSFTKMNSCINEYPDYDYFHFGICSISQKDVKERIPSKSVYVGKLAGSVLLKRILFEQVGGYDENLKFSENTELFHRIHLLPVKFLQVAIISVEYFSSMVGGSKNTQNILHGLLYILDKHKDSLSPHIKFLYHQSAGVIFIRFKKISLARYHFLQALKFKPWKLPTWARLGLTFFPPLAKKIYQTKVSFD